MKRRRKKILGLPIGPQQPTVAERLARPAMTVAGIGAIAVAASRLGRRRKGDASSDRASGGSSPAEENSAGSAPAGERSGAPPQDASVEARSARADMQRHLKSGDVSLQDVFRMAEEDETIARTRVKVLLQNLPGVGSRGAVSAMEELGIAPNRRVGGLGSRQREELLERFAA